MAIYLRIQVIFNASEEIIGIIMFMPLNMTIFFLPSRYLSIFEVRGYVLKENVFKCAFLCNSSLYAL